MIRLSCPQCSTELEIDEGFRGGVCRCFSCGTMMTVPANPEKTLARPVSRPSTPDQIPADTVPAASAADPAVPTARRSRSRLPTERKKRMSVRLLVIAIMVVMMAALLAVVMYAMNAVFTEPPDTEAKIVYEAVGVTTDNPLLDPSPQFITLPLGERTVIMMDASLSMRDYLDQLKQAAQNVIEHLGERKDLQLQLVFWNETAPIAIPEKMTPLNYIGPSTVADRLANVRASGGMAPAAAFVEALKSKPDHIILALHLAPPKEQIDQIAKLVSNAGTRLSVLFVDNSEIKLHLELKDLAESTRGQYKEITGRELQRWYEEYLNEAGAAATPAP